MMNLQKLRSMREGQRRIISRQLEKFEDELTRIEKLELLDVLSQKAEIIRGLNDKIVNHNDTDDIETELFESEEYSIELGLKLRKLKDALQTHNKTEERDVIKDGVPEDHRGISNNASGSSSDDQGVRSILSEKDDARGEIQIQGSNSGVRQSNGDNVSSNFNSFPVHNYHRLPKLKLPEFDGDITQWQSFWDSYESAVHTNQTLSEVQKFNYLRSLLHGRAASAISGFPLTNANYINAIELLKQRFGKPDRIRGSYMQSLLDLPKPDNSVYSLRSFHDQMETLIRGLESLGQNQDSYGDLLVPIILEKLPEQTRQNMARERKTDSGLYLGELRSSLNRELCIMEAGKTRFNRDVNLQTATFFTGSKQNEKNERKRDVKRSVETKLVCHFCGKNHQAVNCYVKTDAKSRLDVVKSKDLCFNCLGKHKVSECKSKYRCRHCQRKHHTSLCEGEAKRSTLNPDAVPFKATNTETNSGRDTAILNSFTHQRHNVLLKTAVAQVDSKQNSVSTNILFDEGAQRSFVTEELAEKLNLEVTGKESICLSSFGGDSRQLRYLPRSTVYLRAEIDEKIPIDVLVVPKIAVPIVTQRSEIRKMKYLRGLKLAHPIDSEEKFEVSLLIGADYYWKIVQDRVIRGNGPTAVKSKIGYLLSGPLTTNEENVTSNHVLEIITSPPDTCELEKFWTLESIGILPDDKPQLSIIDTYKRDNVTYQDGRYVAKLPWKEDHPQLPTNYNITKKRTENTIRRLSRQPKLLEKYAEIIDDQLKRGFIEKVDCTKEVQYPVHYIPHHYVKKDSTTTPIRIVFDCSCSQSSEDPSLNECLLSTPPELNDLTGILLRFRMQRYGVCTDIEKAFLHVGLDERDRDVTRFLWLSDPSNPNSPLTTYRFKAVLFGATCSPFILSATILKHLEDNQNNCVSERLRKDLYVDNVISSFSREEELIEYYKESRILMLNAGFNLRSWSSNSTKLNVRAASDGVLDKDACTKVLGMRWDSTQDHLKFADRTIPIHDRSTKREILQETSKLYDPLGLLSPVTIRAKQLIQELWKGNFDWDTTLPTQIHEKWSNLSGDLNSVTKTLFKRDYFKRDSASQKETSDISIHIFCDASITSYGAVAYICQENKSTLMMAKTRVAPLKTITLPRLELMAAVIGARLCKHLQENTDISKIFLWSDSQIVLSWLQSEKVLPRFVRNRVCEVNSLTNNRNWRYCPTRENPADLLTRGISAKQYKTCDLWFHGPTWINKSDEWPVRTEMSRAITMSTIAESSDTEFAMETDCETLSVIDFTKYSKLSKLQRIVAYVLRFIPNCRVGKSQSRLEPLTPKEIHRAERACIRDCQSSALRDVRADVLSKRNRLSIVKQLQLFVDEDDMVRCRGRIQNSLLHDDAKHPFLLPAKHHYTKLVIKDAHERLLHSGVSSTVTFIRQKYWIPSIRQCVKSVVQKCIPCIKVTGKPYAAPDPPPLPKSRVDDVAPFTYTGVDFTGALNVRDNCGKDSKAYICLFTCATTRAVHLEIVPDLSTDSFLQVFRRFCSRKSTPSVMMSDNGTTFTSAARQLQLLADSDEVREVLSIRRVDWRFIPKRAPWFGGFWERLISLTKSTLKKVLGHSYVTLMALQTIITEIEAVLNDRPLTYVTSDTTREPEILTPSHLLYGRRITTLPHYTERRDIENVNIGGSYLTERATRQAMLISHFRERWRHEYLTALRERHQTNGRNKQKIAVGDVVQIHDDCPRSLWKLAVVEELYQGNDGLIRAAKIKTKNGLTNRAITKLYPLEC